MPVQKLARHAAPPPPAVHPLFRTLEALEAPGTPAFEGALARYLATLDPRVPAAERDALVEAIRAYAGSKQAIGEARWDDAIAGALDAKGALDRAGGALSPRARDDLAGRIVASADLARSLPAIQAASPGYSGRDTFERRTKAPAAPPAAELPPLGGPEVAFTPEDDADLSLAARSSLGYAKAANAKVSSVVPEQSGMIVGKRVPISFQRPQDQPPTPQEIVRRTLEGLGPGAVQASERYRIETGREIGYVDLSPDEIRRAWNPATKAFELQPAPAQALVRTINAYNRGGRPAAEREAARMRAEDARTNAAIKEVQDQPRTMLETIGTGAAEGAMTINQLTHNVTTIGSAIYNQEVYGSDSPEFYQVRNQERLDQAALNRAQASLPEEQTFGARVARGLTSGTVAALPYVGAAAVSGPYGPAAIGVMGNIHRGPAVAAHEGLINMATGGSGRVVAAATEQWGSRLARNLFTRNVEGLTNAGLSFAAGERDGGRLAEQYVIGAAQPVGARPERRGPTVGDPAVPPPKAWRDMTAAERHADFLDRNPTAIGVAGLSPDELRTTFGDGPYAPSLAYLGEQPGFTDFARHQPRDAAALYGASQLVPPDRWVPHAPDLTTAAAEARTIMPVTATRTIAGEAGPTDYRVAHNTNPRMDQRLPAVRLSPPPALDHNGAFAKHGQVRGADGRVRWQPTGETADGTGIRPDQLVVDPRTGQALPDLSQVAMFSGHGAKDRFQGLTTDQAAQAMADEIGNFRRTNPAAPPIRYVVLEACSQGDKRTGYWFGDTNAQAFERSVNRALSAAGEPPVGVLAAEHPGYLYGGGQRETLLPNRFAPERFIPAPDQKGGLTPKAQRYLLVGAGLTGTAAGLGVGGAVLAEELEERRRQAQQAQERARQRQR